MIVFGASGHGKVVLDLLQAQGRRVERFVDDHPTTDAVLGVPVTGNDLPEADDQFEAVIAIGSNRVRQLIDARHRLAWVTGVHPTAAVSPFAEVGEGTVVMAQAAINPSARVGRHCIVNTGVVVEHDCVIGDFAHISPGAALAGNVTVGEGTHVGTGASVIPGVTIGAWATVGAGAVVIRDVPDGATVVGNPARTLER